MTAATWGSLSHGQLKGQVMAVAHVEVSLRDNQTGTETKVSLGEFHAVWEKGITVGSDEDCDIVLRSSEVAGKHVLLTARSNHKFLKALKGSGVKAHGVDVPEEKMVRIDGEELQVVHYSLRILNAGY